MRADELRLAATLASEARYRGLLEAAPDAMVVVDQAGEIVLLNVQAEKQFGYRRDELIGQPVTNIIPEGFAERLIADDLRSAADALAQVIGTGLELVARRRDGTEFPIEIMLSPLDSAEGVLVTAAIRDISVRRAAEVVLVQMEAQYRGLLEAAPDAMVVVNQAGEIVLLNVQAEKQFGYRRDELLGQPVKNIVPDGFAARLIADDLRSAADALAQQIGTGIELAGRRKDGSEFPIEIMLSPLDGADGVLVTAAIRNISARKAAERYLARMEARYRGLLEAAPDAMVVVNAAGEIVLVNAQAEKRFGYQRDELLGQRVTEIIPVGFAERLVADDLRSAAEALAQQIGTGIELVAHRKDGSTFPIEIMLSPLESAEGILVTAAVRDISVRKAAEAELLQAQKLESIGRLAGGIAHDFNNMLSIIHGYSDLLEDDLSAENRGGLDVDAALNRIRAISGAADRAAMLTAQLLAFSRRQVVASEVLDINTSITMIEPMIGQLIGRSVSLVLRLEAAGHIRADAGQIDQLLVNLVVNARDAMPDGGTVTIDTADVESDDDLKAAGLDRNTGPYVRIGISDTGRGMDRGTLEHIFEPFFTTKDLGKGTGLGLATAHGITHRAGGSIAVDSVVGQGTQFRLYFPRVDSPAVGRARIRATPIARAVGRILVVEIEQDLRDLTAQLLQRAGYDVLAVADGPQALALASLPERFDALVTDVDLPNLSGIELAEGLMARDPHLGVVLLSGYVAATMNLDRVTAAGATFASKPITSARLLEAVREAIATRAPTADGDRASSN